MKRFTPEMLDKLNVCRDAKKDYRERFPQGLEPTAEGVLEAISGGFHGYQMEDLYTALNQPLMPDWTLGMLDPGCECSRCYADRESSIGAERESQLLGAIEQSLRAIVGEL